MTRVVSRGSLPSNGGGGSLLPSERLEYVRCPLEKKTKGAGALAISTELAGAWNLRLVQGNLPLAVRTIDPKSHNHSPVTKPPREGDRIAGDR